MDRIVAPLVSIVVLAIVLAMLSPAVEPLGRWVAAISKQPPLTSDDDFYRHHEVIGRDFEIFDWIRTNLPPGETISIYYGGWYPIVTLRSTTRLWLALLPRYRISEDSRYVVCPPWWCQLEPGDEILVQGHRLLLILRAGA